MMILNRRILLSTLALLPALRSTSASAQGADPLPSWNDGATKQSITNFVARVTTQGGPDFVPMDQRIARLQAMAYKDGRHGG